LQYLDKALLDHHKESLVLKIVKIKLLLDINKLYEAKKLYQDQQVQSVKFEFKSGIEGRIAFLEKDFVKAAQKLTLFYQAYPSQKNVLLLALAFKGNNQEVQAQKVLQEYLVKNEQDDRVRMMLADSYLATESEKAVVEYERLIKTQSENYVVLNNLAWLAMESGQLNKALEYTKIAYKLTPKVANITDTYGQILFKLYKKNAALVKSNEAFELSKGENVGIALNYIEILIMNNQKTSVKQLIVKVRARTNEQKNKMKELLTFL
jgi:Tfp pilus assembly protein PilF